MSDPADDGVEMKLDQALLEFMRRFDAGKVEDRDSFLAEFPDLAPQLRTLLDAADWIENMAGPTLGELARSTSKNSVPNSRADADNAEPSPNAITLPVPSAPKRDGQPNRRTQISINDSTLPPQTNQADFSLTSLPNPDNSQSILPYRFGDYILERVLGRGGMGVVYLAYQVQLERRVAIKMIRSGCLASEEEVDRFYTEARSAASLTHPNIVTVYHCGEIDGHHYFSMDYVPGTDLAKRIVSGPMSPKEAVRYVRDVARAIDYAHEQGVVHRDLKPANVLIGQTNGLRQRPHGNRSNAGNSKLHVARTSSRKQCRSRCFDRCVCDRGCLVRFADRQAAVPSRFCFADDHASHQSARTHRSAIQPKYSHGPRYDCHEMFREIARKTLCFGW